MWGSRGLPRKRSNNLDIALLIAFVKEL